MESLYLSGNESNANENARFTTENIIVYYLENSYCADGS
jgi:hypothetical protein